ncbi:exodeoxyribonuclease VII large subunit, partial [Bordetella petrii]|uniref:exodeoxyribonuclease VII large subunit n=1 Tax=Bordetella petrii TaxID=94624 RepID=UPI002E7718BF
RQAQARQLASQQARIAAVSAHLRALDPQHTLARGYAIVRDEHGNILRDAAPLAPGQELGLTFAEGGARVQVLGKQ